MNRLSTADRVRIVTCLIEGCSIRSTCRMTGFAKGTVLKLLAEIGTACAQFHDEAVRNLRSERIQADEVWCFCHCKDKNVPDSMRGMAGVGSVWTFKAIDADSKLLISYHLGDRDADNAREFMLDLAGRLLTRVQLTTDGMNGYRSAVWEAFGSDVDYAKLIKVYGAPQEHDTRYSPAICTGTIKSAVCGSPIPRDVSTSFIERSNLTLRMTQRRFTRLTNAFSKKFANLHHAVSLYAVHYNFCKVHQTLRVTPAMESGLASHVWSIADLVGLLEKSEAKAIEAGALKRGPYRKAR